MSVLPVFALVCAMLLATATAAQDAGRPAATCDAANQPLAFWIGDWDVYADGKLDGRSSIENTLGGCAVLERWDDASGFKGMSLFYFEPHTHQWKQVWVTDHALAPGGTKEKVMLYASDDLVRFQGSVWAAHERMLLDRTTLKKLADNRVSQVIEISKDGGATWTKSYDALYRRRTEEHREK